MGDELVSQKIDCVSFVFQIVLKDIDRARSFGWRR